MNLTKLSDLLMKDHEVRGIISTSYLYRNAAGFNLGNTEPEEEMLNALKSALIIAFTYSQAKECSTPQKLNLFFRKL